MKSILKLVLGTIVLVVLIGLFLPSAAHVERTILVKGSPENVYRLVTNLKEWEKWSPWHKIDPKMELTYGEKFEGQGGWYSWKSENDNVGNGKLTILEASPGYVKTEMDFMENGKAIGGFTLTPKPEGTEVKWTMDSDAGWNLIARYFGLMVDNFVGPDFEKGLHLLDSVSQLQKVEEYTMSLEMGNIPAQKYLLIKMEGITQAEIGAKLGEVYGKVIAFMKEAGLTETGAPMAFYEEPKDGKFTFEAGMPVVGKPSIPLKDNLIYKELPASEVAIAHFSGPYEKTSFAYPALENLIKEKGKTISGMPMESYVSDPMEAKNPLDIKTDIIWPVK